MYSEIRKKTTIAQRILLMLTVSGLFTLVAFSILFHFKNKKEEEIATLSMIQFNHEVQSILNLYEAKLKQVVFDYTYWDELVENIKPDNQQWFDENISTIVSSFHFDYAGVYDVNRKLVHEAWSDNIKPGNFMPRQALDCINTNRFADYFTIYDSSLLAISAATIHGTNDPFHTRTPVSGYLVLAKKWDKTMLNELSGILGAGIQLGREIKDSVPGDKFTLKMTHELKDFDQKLVDKLVVSREFPVLRLYDSAARYLFGAVLFLIFTALAFFYYTSRRWVSKPLKLVSNVLRNEDMASLSALRKSSEEFRRIALLFDDYMMQKEELVRAREKAEESDRLKSAFLANISHEIRTPMNGILGFTELLRDPGLDQESRAEYLGIVERSGKQLLNLINDIIDISKIEAGLMHIRPEDCSLNKVLRDVGMMFNSNEKIRNNTLELRLKLQFSDEASWVRIDEQRLAQILINLVGNAMKFTHSGFVEFGYKLSNDNRLLIFCKDTGIGIAPEKQQVIFDRFFQVSDTTNRQYEGTGLGLAISKSLAELMDGSIWVESEPGKGSAFFISLPFIPVEKGFSRIYGDDFATDVPSLETKTILVAEDVAVNFQFLKATLDKTNATVVWAKNGKEAVEMALAIPHPDLILMDLKMPLMNGYEATRLIKAQLPNIPIVAQTAYSLDGDRQKSIEAGCDEHIAKPIQTQELYKILSALLA